MYSGIVLAFKSSSIDICILHLGAPPSASTSHDDVIKWKHFPRNWPFVRGSHRSPVTSPHKGQWRGALHFFFCAWINGWANNGKADDLRRYRAHYDVTVMHRTLHSISISLQLYRPYILIDDQPQWRPYFALIYIVWNRILVLVEHGKSAFQKPYWLGVDWPYSTGCNAVTWNKPSPTGQ